MRSHHDGSQKVDGHQARAFEQDGQAAQRAGVLARQQRQRARQQKDHQRSDPGDTQECGAPAQGFTQHTSQRNTQYHRQRSAGRQQTEGLDLFARRRDAHGKGRRDRPEHRMRKRNADTAHQQNREAGRHRRDDVADHKQAEHKHQQFAALDVTRRQHHGQRHQRDDPGIDRQHQTHLCRRHVEALADIA